MSKKSKKFQIISETIEDLKRQLEEKPSGERVYLLTKQPGKEVYEWSNKELYEGKGDKEFYSSWEEFRQIKGADIKRDIILIVIPASEDPNIEEHRRKEPTSIH